MTSRINSRISWWINLYTNRSYFIEYSSSYSFGKAVWSMWIMSLIGCSIWFIIGLLLFFWIAWTNSLSQETIISQTKTIITNIANTLPEWYILHYNSLTGLSSNYSGTLHIKTSDVLKGLFGKQNLDTIDNTWNQHLVSINTNNIDFTADILAQSLVTVSNDMIITPRRMEWNSLDISQYQMIPLTNNAEPVYHTTITSDIIKNVYLPLITIFINDHWSTVIFRLTIILIVWWILWIFIVSWVIAILSAVLMFIFALIPYCVWKLSKQSWSYRTSYGMMSTVYIIPLTLWFVISLWIIWNFVLTIIIRSIIIYKNTYHKIVAR